VQATGLDTYPDVSVVCGRAERDSQDRDAIVNPLILVEVTSPGTEDYDRGEKLEHYQRIPSLREVVFVAHDARRLEVVRRGTGATWSTDSAVAGGTLRLESLGQPHPHATGAARATFQGLMPLRNELAGASVR
jgi:Uma2 family endonuclease